MSEQKRIRRWNPEFKLYYYMKSGTKLSLLVLLIVSLPRASSFSQGGRLRQRRFAVTKSNNLPEVVG